MNRSKTFFLAAVALGLVVGVFVAIFQNRTPQSPPRENVPPLQAMGDLPRPPVRGQSYGPEIDELLQLRNTNKRGKKVHLASSLRPGLDEEQREVLLYEIVNDIPPGVELGGYADYFHQLCLALLRQTEGRERLAQALALVVVDEDRAPALRDYSLQHLRTVWELSRSDRRFQQSIESAFRRLVDDDHLGAAALLSLHLLEDNEIVASSEQLQIAESGARRRIPNDEMTPHLKPFLEKNLHPEKFLTAIRIIKERRLAEFLPQLRVASTGENGEHVMVQMAAISALSKFQQPEDERLLQSLQSHDPMIIRAKAHALAAFKPSNS